jgi:zinc transporter ZupT
MTTNTRSGPSGRVGPLTITALVFAVVLPPVGGILGFFAARRESNLGYAAVFLGLVGTVLGFTAGIALLSPVIAADQPTADGGPSNPIVGFTIALVVLAVVAVVGSLLWAKFTKKHDTGKGSPGGYPQRNDR